MILISAVARCQKHLNQQNDLLRFKVLINNLQPISKNPKKIIITDRENIFAVDIQEILYLRADGAYSHIKTINNQIMASKNLKYFEELLISAGFYRVHHSYLCNLNQMVRFDKPESIMELSKRRKNSGFFSQKRRSNSSD